MDEQTELYFLSALGETFCQFVSPPIPEEYADPHECCEALWNVLGDNITPEVLNSVDEAGIKVICSSFSDYFESDAPSEENIKKALAEMMIRWPLGSASEEKDAS